MLFFEISIVSGLLSSRLNMEQGNTTSPADSSPLQAFKTSKIGVRREKHRYRNSNVAKKAPADHLIKDGCEENRSNGCPDSGSDELGATLHRPSVGQSGLRDDAVASAEYALTCCGSPEEARCLAVANGKLLLIFFCTTDREFMQIIEDQLFSDTTVQQTLALNCVYFKICHDCPNAIRLVNFYKMLEFPAMLMINPYNEQEVARFNGELWNKLVFRKKLFNLFPNCPRQHEKPTTDRLLNPFAMEEKPPYSKIIYCEKKRKNTEAKEIDPKRRKSNGNENTIQMSIMHIFGVLMSDDYHLSNETNALCILDSNEWKNMVVQNSPPCSIRFRLPIGDGGRIETAIFSMHTQLSALFVFIRGRGLSPSRHIIILSFPRREFTLAQANMSLYDLGFSKSEHVHVDIIPNDDC
ncbi:UBX domain protein [Dictyocaulus viviparus]|uniref:UBX domain protein n=1 Tax=Dictyocaulus viviparus TaxID=29172 RepID=A0A0D8XL92_DICVI|nr:UBX domain protein [Dictyocaulus viviparus]